MKLIEATQYDDKKHIISYDDKTTYLYFNKVLFCSVNENFINNMIASLEEGKLKEFLQSTMFNELKNIGYIINTNVQSIEKKGLDNNIVWTSAKWMAYYGKLHKEVLRFITAKEFKLLNNKGVNL